MRNPNGFGSINKLSGNRRKPYRVRVTTGYEIDEDGRTRQIQRTVGTYATYQEAMDALTAYNKNPVSLEPGVTFAEIYRRWSAGRFAATKENTHKSYTAAFNAVPMLQNMEFRDIRTVHLQNAIDTCGKNLPTLQNIVVIISGMYDYAMSNDIVSKDYSRFIDLSAYRTKEKQKKRVTPPKHVPFTESELSVLWNNQEDAFIREILALCYSGLRIKEYLELPPEAIDIPARIITIDDSKTEAGLRLVPIHERTTDIWEEIRASRQTETDPRTFEARYHDFQKHMGDRLEELSLYRHLPHDTRHTVPTILRERRADPLIVKRILGHKVKDITERVYTHTDIENLIRTINLM